MSGIASRLGGLHLSGNHRFSAAHGGCNYQLSNLDLAILIFFTFSFRPPKNDSQEMMKPKATLRFLLDDVISN